MPIKDPEFLKGVEEHRQRLVVRLARMWTAQNDVNAERGRLLAAIARLEGEIEGTLMIYFRSEQPAELFDWVVRPMPFSRKLQLVRELTNVLGFDGQFDQLFRQINDVVAVRNSCAHDALNFVGSSFEAEDGNYELEIGRQYAAHGKAPALMNMAELKGAANQAEELSSDYLMLHLSVMEVLGDDQPRPEDDGDRSSAC